jgi:hypothetical protein
MPSRGENKTYPVLLQFLAGVPVGTAVTWSEIELVCGKEMKQSGRSTLAKVKIELERTYGKKLSLPESRGYVVLDAGTDTTERMRDLSPCYEERVVRTEEGDTLS